MMQREGFETSHACQVARVSRAGFYRHYEKHEPRQADVRALTYCRLLVLRKADFDRFMHEDRSVRLKIHQIAQTRAALNRSNAAGAAL